MPTLGVVERAYDITGRIGVAVRGHHGQPDSLQPARRPGSNTRNGDYDRDGNEFRYARHRAFSQ